MMSYIIETHNLSKIYQGRAVVDNLSIHIKKGEIYGFVGPNGAGKSTLMKMLLNLVKPDAGEITIFSNNLLENNFEILKRIGSIIENPYFYTNLTARQNLDLHCEYMGYHNKNHIENILECVGLLKDADKKVSKYSLGMKQRLRQNLDLHCEYMGYHNKNHIENILECVGLLKDADKKVSKYSLGMKQRLSIARAILTKPEILILDEPINALDPEGIREMRNLFYKLRTDYGVTILISSHILSEVEQIADTIGIIQNGKLLKEISMSEIHKYKTEYIEADVDKVELAGYILEHDFRTKDFKIISENCIEIYDSKITVKNISATFVKNGIGINSIGRKQNSLEDFFFQVTESKVVENI